MDLGSARAELADVKFCAESVAIGNYYRTICSRNFLEGCSAHMLAGERQGVGWLTTFANQMRKHYGLNDKGAKFWLVHLKVCILNLPDVCFFADNVRNAITFFCGMQALP